MKQAIIDIGSNSMRLTVYEIDGKAFRPLFREKVMAGLAGYVEKGALSPEGLERAVAGLREFKSTAETLGISNTAVFATASLRNISNTTEALAAIKASTGYAVDLISGREEALYGYAGAMVELGLSRGAFVDIGGASTEIASFSPGEPVSGLSFGIGSLSLYRDCVKKILPGHDALKKLRRIIETENILLRRMPGLFGSYQVCESCVISVTRNADISFDDEKFDDSEEDFRSRVLKLLKKRDSLSVMRLEISEKISEPFLSSLTALVHVEKRQIYFDSCPLNMKYVYPLAGDLPPQKAQALLYPPYHARWPEDIRPDRGMIAQIREKDRLLFFPFDAVDPFLRLLSEAAEREDVVSIKISIYRLASSSKIARALCRAAENGKEVVVLMELRARFDEANNISWSKLLEDAGCQVVYGVEDFKCHSKLCLITMREKGRLNYITQVGTGNYNEKTSAMYTDLSFMTASEQIGRDAAAFFRNMLVNNLAGEYKRMLVAPAGIKPALLALIDEQAALGSEGYICVKANAVTEREVIDRLMEASRAGVEIQLIIRGICCILPGVPDYTENVHVTSIVGRYLEHARIYCFGRGEHAKLFISSADFMTRNLNRRVEIACPIEDREIKAQLLKILQVQLADSAKASFMMPDGVYGRKSAGQSAPLDSQREFMERSLHHPAPAPAPRPGPGAKIAAFFRKVLA